MQTSSVFFPPMRRLQRKIQISNETSSARDSLPLILLRNLFVRRLAVILSGSCLTFCFDSVRKQVWELDENEKHVWVLTELMMCGGNSSYLIFIRKCKIKLSDSALFKYTNQLKSWTISTIYFEVKYIETQLIFLN